MAGTNDIICEENIANEFVCDIIQKYGEVCAACVFGLTGQALSPSSFRCMNERCIMYRISDPFYMSCKHFSPLVAFHDGINNAYIGRTTDYGETVIEDANSISIKELEEGITDLYHTSEFTAYINKQKTKGEKNMTKVNVSGPDENKVKFSEVKEGCFFIMEDELYRKHYDGKAYKVSCWNYQTVTRDRLVEKPDKVNIKWE